MSAQRCLRCGLINFANATACRRCRITLGNTGQAEESADRSVSSNRLVKGLIRVFAVVCLLLLIAYASLILTSDRISIDQKLIVSRAIDLLDEKGFTREAFILRHLVSYRATDNWWNRWIGHGDAYAATNFPFEVVTLYPHFFTRSVDDVERAAILLHEVYHLRGYGESKAHEGVWRDKQKLGWTKEQYGQTRVWKNVREFTQKFAPHLFQCGLDGRSDCLEQDSVGRKEAQKTQNRSS
jgi:hypothetical protein